MFHEYPSKISIKVGAFVSYFSKNLSKNLNLPLSNKCDEILPKFPSSVECSDYISCQSVGKKLAVVEVCVGKVDRVRSRAPHHPQEPGPGEQHLLHQENKDIQPAPVSQSQQYGEWRLVVTGPVLTGNISIIRILSVGLYQL